MGLLIGGAVAAVLAAVLGLAARKPGTFRIERTTTVRAPAERIFPLLADFRKWRAWSPWEEVDPNLERRYSGAAEGVGAVYEWSGNGKAGAGRMEIERADPSTAVVIRLDFSKPFRASNVAEFTLAPAGDGTTVTWAMHGPALFMIRVMGVFMNMDELIAKDFEKGLAKLKAAAEHEGAGAAP